MNCSHCHSKLSPLYSVDDFCQSFECIIDNDNHYFYYLDSNNFYLIFFYNNLRFIANKHYQKDNLYVLDPKCSSPKSAEIQTTLTLDNISSQLSDYLNKFVSLKAFI